MNELIIKIFVNSTIENIEKIMFKLELISKDYFQFDIIKNHDFDKEKSKFYPDGFLYFPLFIEYYKEDNLVTKDDINNSVILLKSLWENNISAIASCDFEDQLPENGGYKSKKIPWNSIQ